MAFGLSSLPSVPITTSMNNQKSRNKPPPTVGSIWMGRFGRDHTVGIVSLNNGTNLQVQTPKTRMAMNVDVFIASSDPVDLSRNDHKVFIQRAADDDRTSKAWMELYLLYVAKENCTAYVRLCKDDLAEIGLEI